LRIRRKRRRKKYNNKRIVCYRVIYLLTVVANHVLKFFFSFFYHEAKNFINKHLHIIRIKARRKDILSLLNTNVWSLVGCISLLHYTKKKKVRRRTNDGLILAKWRLLCALFSSFFVHYLERFTEHISVVVSFHGKCRCFTFILRSNLVMALVLCGCVRKTKTLLSRLNFNSHFIDKTFLFLTIWIDNTFDFNFLMKSSSCTYMWYLETA
jgi:hypothetical protein